MTQLLDGARRPAISGKTSSLVVLLHGYGADGQDLFGLAEPLSAVLPDSAFAAPNAPEPCEMGGPGFQWFGLMNAQGWMEIREHGADQAAPLLVAYLEAELARYRLDASRLALVGFSQGTMMALHVGLRMAPSPAAIVGFSGTLVAPARLPAEKSGTPPVLLVHGAADPVVPFTQLAISETGLREAEVPVETLVRPGLGHSIDEIGLRTAALFVRRTLNT